MFTETFLLHPFALFTLLALAVAGVISWGILLVQARTIRTLTEHRRRLRLDNVALRGENLTLLLEVELLREAVKPSPSAEDFDRATAQALRVVKEPRL